MRLVVDLGGTRLRMALGVAGRLMHAERVVLPERTDPIPALRDYLEARGHLRGDVEGVVEARVAVAGPVVGGAVTLTNRPRALEAGALAGALGLAKLRLVNDLEAAAWGVAQDLEGGRHLAGPARAEGPVLVVGVGTGLGTALWVPAAGVALAAEGGHATASARDDEEAEILARLRRQLGHVSCERVASGSGLLRLDSLLAPNGQTSAAPRDPAVVWGLTDPRARRAAQQMLRFLGAYVGNLALCTGAWGGVVFVGGVLPRLRAVGGDALLGPLHEAFLDKGRLGARLNDVPLRLVSDDDIGLRGLAAMP